MNMKLSLVMAIVIPLNSLTSFSYAQPGGRNHYLPADRARMNGVWKVVSTETDTYYHRPDCPHMLAKSADGVLGFASTGDAQEAGYLPDPDCMYERGLFSPRSRGYDQSQVTLLDGSSSITLPTGWRKDNSLSRAEATADSRGNRDSYTNAFVGPHGQYFVIRVSDFSHNVALSGVDFGLACSLNGLVGSTAGRMGQFENLIGNGMGEAKFARPGSSRRAGKISLILAAEVGGLNGTKCLYQSAGKKRSWMIRVAGRGQKMYLLLGPPKEDLLLQQMADALSLN